MKAPVKTVTDRLHSASWHQPIPCEAKRKSVNSQEEPAASIIQAVLRAESKAFQACLQGIVKRMQERRADFPTAFIIHPCTLIRVFTMQPEHMQHAAQTITARCVGNHSTLRMELHRTAGKGPSLWSRNDRRVPLSTQPSGTKKEMLPGRMDDAAPAALSVGCLYRRSALTGPRDARRTSSAVCRAACATSLSASHNRACHRDCASLWDPPAGHTAPTYLCHYRSG